jgi:site-specific recombinase XerD
MYMKVCKSIELEEPLMENISPAAIVPTFEPDLMEVSIPVPSDLHPACVYVASLGVRTKRVAESDLNVIARLLTGARWDEEGKLWGGQCGVFTLTWGALRYQHAAAVRSALAEHYAHTTANRMLSGLRGVLKAAWQLGVMPTEDYHKAVAIKPVKGESLPRGRALKPGELHALFDVCRRDESTAGIRDTALFAVLYGAGLRRAEVVGLDLADYDRETGALTVRHGKGNKARIGYATNGSQVALEMWLRVRGDKAGPLFLPVLKNGRIVERRLSTQAVFETLRTRAAQAKIKDVSPHDFRRTFISDLLDRGADIVTVQKLAGHANVTTTARYDRRGEISKRKAAELLHIPV